MVGRGLLGGGLVEPVLPLAVEPVITVVVPWTPQFGLAYEQFVNSGLALGGGYGLGGLGGGLGAGGVGPAIAGTPVGFGVPVV